MLLFVLRSLTWVGWRPDRHAKSSHWWHHLRHHRHRWIHHRRRRHELHRYYWHLSPKYVAGRLFWSGVRHLVVFKSELGVIQVNFIQLLKFFSQLDHLFLYFPAKPVFDHIRGHTFHSVNIIIDFVSLRHSVRHFLQNWLVKLTHMCGKRGCSRKLAVALATGEMTILLML